MIPSFAKYRPSGYAAVVLADTPYAYFKLEESSGTVMHDSSGNGRNGTFSGSSAPTTGLVLGSAVARQFTGGYAATTFSAIGWTSMALEAWAIVPSAPAGASASYILCMGSPNITWDHPSTSFQKVVTINNGGWNACSHGAAANTLVHLGLDWDGTTLRAYVNGTQVSSTAVSGSVADVSPTSNFFGIAAGSAGGSNPLACTVAHAAVYHHSLSAARWAAHYAAGH
ncbi:hypothetical protein KDX40_12940 [Burkholderia ambifaria]|uniref:LamG-like jellyroll fold domain-containing protein n=1 Tax=Burkholderia ambifaria TaxID=152480 RepID=UPI001B9F44D6|nr:LamG-like jellyroll fold domain-containing protein [Burkholderia ambifaria]MBR8344644.1 hypothetical protein [Burkholderia ambifaria]